MSEIPLTFLSAEFLRSFAGAVFVTNIIVHFIKDYLPQTLDQRIVTLGVAIFVVTMNVLVFENISEKTIYVAVVNGFLVAVTATGNYEILTKKTKRALLIEKKENEDKILRDKALQEDDTIKKP